LALSPPEQLKAVILLEIVIKRNRRDGRSNPIALKGQNTKYAILAKHRRKKGMFSTKKVKKLEIKPVQRRSRAMFGKNYANAG
jgi:hypothetical protein